MNILSVIGFSLCFYFYSNLINALDRTSRLLYVFTVETVDKTNNIQYLKLYFCNFPSLQNEQGQTDYRRKVINRKGEFETDN